MKMSLLFTLWMMVSPCLLAQDEGDMSIVGKETSDHLWPVDNDYGHRVFVSEYLNDIELADEEYAVAEASAFPPFKPSQRITVFENEKAGQFRLVLTVSIKPENQHTQGRDFKSTFKVIDNTSANLINYLFEEVLIETKYSRHNKHISGLDGTVYQFSVTGKRYGIMFGETWSPRAGIPPRILVDVFKLLSAYVNGDVSAEQLSVDLQQFKHDLDKNKNDVRS